MKTLPENFQSTGSCNHGTWNHFHEIEKNLGLDSIDNTGKSKKEKKLQASILPSIQAQN